MESLKKLKEKREQLINGFLKKKEPDFLNKHAALLDDYFYNCFEKSMAGRKIGLHKKPYAIVALGGYGRKEQCVCSDVDILFLFKQINRSEVEALVEEIIYPLWDIGLEVGHATRTVQECINLSLRDTEVLTSILDARFICGVSSLFTNLMEKMRSMVINGHVNDTIQRIVEENRKRHEKYGNSSYRLEPNLKQGDGGLRDYHTILWVAKVEMNLKGPKDLEYYGYLSDDEFQEMNRSLSFIWNVRNHLHFLSQRKYDRLHFEYQKKIAGILGFKGTKEHMAVEKFLAELHDRMEYIKNHNLIVLSERGYTGSLTSKRKKVKKKTAVPGLEISRNMLNFSSTEDILTFPGQLIKIFEEGARLKIPLCSEARRVVKDFSHLVGKDFRTDESNIRSFERILLSGDYVFEVLNEMLHSGFLLRFIPEIKKIYNRIQYDAYHLYPVGRHSLYTVKTIAKFAFKDTDRDSMLYRNLYQGLGRYKKFLLWAALLHDVGKGEKGGGHSQKGAFIAEKVMKRSGYGKTYIETVSFLINEHLLLAKTATRRDITDEETALFCARRIKSVRLLKMLYLLTVADSISTGPKAWNDWTSALFRDLFFKILKILEKGELATRRAVASAEKKKEEVIIAIQPGDDRKAVIECFTIFSPRYLLYVPTREILDHIKLYRRLEDRDFVWDIEKNKGSDTRRITICAKDKPGLFSKISGVFTLNGLDILDVQAFTWKNNIAFDIFTVTPPQDLVFEDDKWKRIEKVFNAVLKGEMDISDELRKKEVYYNKGYRQHVHQRIDHVEIDNESSSFFTIIEVFANDRPGLLFKVADALFRCSLNVHVAKIATKVDQAVDIFYVRDLYDRKIDDPEREIEIKETVLHALGKDTP
jgi:[protein-PII] uridylyltransferase